ncbi:hypothetical protein SLEP1_g43183 [Rubroshorea leprosula]|uniref:Uncharacterized protein n=1 Tax=Rubroshorea leprosula TaxID=152421 RepID=A0AAV5LD71_9ROSI|nr:hypothetical protein SLEP1_g43183 [Rubroshorea leprosula]
MATAVIVKNNGRKDMTLTSALFSNVKFKKRGGTAVQGLGVCSEEKHGVIWKQKHVPLNNLKQKLSPVYAASPEQRLNTSHFDRNLPEDGLLNLLVCFSEKSELTILGS